MEGYKGEDYTFKIPTGMPHQMEIWKNKNPNTIDILTGPLGSGKTHTLCVEAALLSAINHPAPGLLIVPDFPMYESTHKREWPQLLGSLGLNVEATGGVLPRLKFPWGSEIFVRTNDRPEKISAVNAGFMLMDEPAQQHEETYRRGLSRIRHPLATCKRAVLAGTPEGINWFAKVARDTRPMRGWIKRWIKAKGWHPDLEGYRDRLMDDWSHDPAALRTYAFGEFVPLRHGRVYSAWRDELHIAHTLPYTPHSPLHLSCDFNVQAMRWVVWQIVGNEIHVLKVMAPDEGASVLELGKLFVHEWGHHEGPVYLSGDATGRGRTALTGTSAYDSLWPTVYAKWNKAVFDVPKANPPVTDRVRNVNHHLRGAGGYKILVNEEHCQPLITDMRENIWKTGIPDIKKSYDGDEKYKTHSGDAFGYGLWARLPLELDVDVKRSRVAKDSPHRRSIMEERF